MKTTNQLSDIEKKILQIHEKHETLVYLDIKTGEYHVIPELMSLITTIQKEAEEKTMDIMGIFYKAGVCTFLSGPDLISCVEDIKEQVRRVLSTTKESLPLQGEQDKGEKTK